MIALLDPARAAAPDQSPPGMGIAWHGAFSLAGIALLGMGALTVFAWATGNVEYVQFDSALAPLHYNAGIGLLIWGTAFLALGAGRFRAARVLSYYLFAFGALLLAANLSKSGFGLDRWLFAPPLAYSAAPLKPAPLPLIFGLVLAGAGILLASSRKAAAIHAILLGVIGFILLFGGPAALAAAMHGSASIRTPAITVLGAAASAVAGLAFLASSLRRGAPHIGAGPGLPLAVAVLGVVGTFGLWVGLNTEQNGRLHRQIQFEADQMHRLVKERLPAEAASVDELTERLSRTDPKRIKEEAIPFIDDHHGCLGIARVLPGLNLEWVEARQAGPNRAFEELGLSQSAVESIRAGQAVAARPPRSRWQGSRVLVLFAPHRTAAGQPSKTGLIAVFRLQTLLDGVLNPNVAPGYAISIEDDQEQIFGRSSIDEEYRNSWSQTLPIRFESLQWKMIVWPTREVMSRESLSLPKLALFIGLMTTCLLALAVHLAQTARRRTADLEREVHEREQTQAALRESEEKYRSLIENLRQGIFLLDRDLRYVAANPVYCSGVKRGEADLVGHTDADLFDPIRASKYLEEAGAVLKDGKTIESEEEREHEGRRACIRRLLYPVRDAEGRITGVLGICWDVTEQRRLETHVHQASKMDAIGQLAGGIAHDFNNLLTAIIGNLALILEESDSSDTTQELAAAAHGAATRAASLTQRLLGFSRRHKLDWVPTNINSIVEEVVALLGRTIDPLVRIEPKLAPELWHVLADPTQLNQVLMNLCINARDAMPGGGSIAIETASVSEEALPARGLTDHRGDFVRLRVSDTGVGMSDEVKTRIYEPFFTTKDVGKGTGLGLPMVFAIVRQHKGWIDCWSELGRGTRFDIYLPRAEGVRPAGPNTLTPLPRRIGKETVLVVDDEEMIRRVAIYALKSSGFSVLEAADGQEALELYSRESGRIDLVVLDLTMPVLSGHEAFRRLIQLDPRVKVLFASGYAEDKLTDFETALMAGFLMKPYRPGELISAVQAALQGPSRHPAGDTHTQGAVQTVQMAT